MKSRVEDPGPSKCIVLIWSTGSLLMSNNRISVYLSVFASGRNLRVCIQTGM